MFDAIDMGILEQSVPGGNFGFGMASRLYAGGAVSAGQTQFDALVVNEFSGGESVSLSCWVQPQQLAGTYGGFQAIFGMGRGFNVSDGQVRIIQGGDDKLKAQLYFDTTSHLATGTSPVVVVGQWYHVVLTFDSGTQDLKLYVDDTLHDTVASANWKIATFVGQIGESTTSTGPAPGGNVKVADARIYSKELSAAEVSQLYNGFQVSDSLLGAYNWDSVEGNGAGDAVNHANPGTYDGTHFAGTGNDWDADGPFD